MSQPPLAEFISTQPSVSPQLADVRLQPPGFDNQQPMPDYVTTQPMPDYVTTQPMTGYVSSQPMPGFGHQSAGWNNSAVPVGLELLVPVDKLIIKQKIDLLEVAFHCESINQYEILNSKEQKQFEAKEGSCCLVRNLCGPLRPFHLEISDLEGADVIHLERPFRCRLCLLPYCLQKLNVFNGASGKKIGSVREMWSLCRPWYSINAINETKLFHIMGPVCTSCRCFNVDFDIQSVDGKTKYGKISKKWSGYTKEIATDADVFGINFPVELDPKAKASLIGAVFLLDFMYYER